MAIVSPHPASACHVFWAFVLPFGQIVLFFVDGGRAFAPLATEYLLRLSDHENDTIMDYVCFECRMRLSGK